MKLRVVTAMVVLGVANCVQQANEPPPPVDIVDGGRRVLVADGFENPQAPRGWQPSVGGRARLEIVGAPGGGDGSVLLATADSSPDGRASVRARFTEPMRAGQRVEVTARLYMPGGQTLNNLSLFELACESCGPDWGPGPRLALFDGAPVVERVKLGLPALQAEEPVKLPVARWFHLRWRVDLGTGDADSLTMVFLDGQPVLRRAGLNMPSRLLEQRLRTAVAAEQIDRIDIGVAHNESGGEAQVYVDDLRIALLE